ncbi:MAG TPA: pilin glycosylation ligase domain-containing protein, partial [Ramlibacter sp.]|nr:pilin glycosylation ligase domain-containing protein [Ramlibacter sp.]
MPPAALRAGGALFAALLVVPWLWPFTVGPSPNVVPLLASWACLLLALPLGAWLAAAGAPLRPLVPAAWLLAALLSSAIGLAQWFGAAPATDWISDASIGEAFGNLRQRNHFASLTSIGLAALLLLAGRTRPRWLWSGAAWLALANAASASRTGLLQWLVLALLFALWPGPRRERTQLALVALAAYAAAAFALPIALWEWRGVEPANAFGRAVSELGCSSRRVLWSNVLHLIAQRPWTGWGVGELDFAHYMTLYPGDRFCDIL